MTIQQLLEMPIGQKAGGFPVTIKTAKKKWEVNGKWYHQVVIMDDTGEMLADVCIHVNVPLQRTQTLWVIVSIVQQADKGKKLYIDQFRHETINEPPEALDFGAGESEKTIRSKIMCWLTSAKVQTGATNKEVLTYITDPVFREILDVIMEG